VNVNGLYLRSRE